MKRGALDNEELTPTSGHKTSRCSTNPSPSSANTTTTTIAENRQQSSVSSSCQAFLSKTSDIPWCTFVDHLHMDGNMATLPKLMCHSERNQPDRVRFLTMRDLKEFVQERQSNLMDVEDDDGHRTSKTTQTDTKCNSTTNPFHSLNYTYVFSSNNKLENNHEDTQQQVEKQEKQQQQQQRPDKTNEHFSFPFRDTVKDICNNLGNGLRVISKEMSKEGKRSYAISWIPHYIEYLLKDTKSGDRLHHELIDPDVPCRIHLDLDLKLNYNDPSSVATTTPDPFARKKEVAKWLSFKSNFDRSVLRFLEALIIGLQTHFGLLSQQTLSATTVNGTSSLTYPVSWVVLDASCEKKISQHVIVCLNGDSTLFKNRRSVGNYIEKIVNQEFEEQMSIIEAKTVAAIPVEQRYRRMKEVNNSVVSKSTITTEFLRNLKGGDIKQNKTTPMDGDTSEEQEEDDDDDDCDNGRDKFVKTCKEGRSSNDHAIWDYSRNLSNEEMYALVLATVDMGVYKGEKELRLLESSKYGQNRPILLKEKRVASLRVDSAGKIGLNYVKITKNLHYYYDSESEALSRSRMNCVARKIPSFVHVRDVTTLVNNDEDDFVHFDDEDEEDEGISDENALMNMEENNNNNNNNNNNDSNNSASSDKQLPFVDFKVAVKGNDHITLDTLLKLPTNQGSDGHFNLENMVYLQDVFYDSLVVPFFHKDLQSFDTLTLLSYVNLEEELQIKTTNLMEERKRIAAKMLTYHKSTVGGAEGNDEMTLTTTNHSLKEPESGFSFTTCATLTDNHIENFLSRRNYMNRPFTSLAGEYINDNKTDQILKLILSGENSKGENEEQDEDDEDTDDIMGISIISAIASNIEIKMGLLDHIPPQRLVYKKEHIIGPPGQEIHYLLYTTKPGYKGCQLKALRCGHKNLYHEKNNVYFMVRLNDCTFYQKCHDPECREFYVKHIAKLDFKTVPKGIYDDCKKSAHGSFFKLSQILWSKVQKFRENHSKLTMWDKTHS